MNFFKDRLPRILFAIPFVLHGFIHFSNAKGLMEYVPALIPGGIVWIYLSGLVMILSGIGLVTDWYAELSSKILALMLFVAIVTVHLPVFAAHGLSHDTSTLLLLKDTSLLGAMLTYTSLLERDLI